MVLDGPQLVETKRLNEVAKRKLILKNVVIRPGHGLVAHAIHRPLLHVGHILEPKCYANLHGNLLPSNL